MTDLISHNKQISTIFQLLGEDENDITLSMSWALANCPEFLTLIVSKICGVLPNPKDTTVYNQKYDAISGITDIEITDHKFFHIIIEAKKGWNLPNATQLTKYSQRNDFINSACPHKHIVSISECNLSYATAYLPFNSRNGIPVSHIPYSRIYKIATSAIATSNHAQKHLLTEFRQYLGGIMTMQNKYSNWVYVVSLGTSTPDSCNLTWIDIVNTKQKYFHPLGLHGWPKEPPNYIAFRYYGQLQSIHHIENYTVSRNLHNEIPEIPDKTYSDDYYVYDLGPAIIPQKVIKTGGLYANGRVWAMLDTLLTCNTIKEARDLSQNR